MKKKNKFKILCFDMDGVICTTLKNKNYKKSKPKKKIISFINQLYETNKYKIKVFTARGMGKFNSNKKLVKKNYYKLTKNQLDSWGLKYHELIMYKTSYDLFVDDKAYGFKENWNLDFKNKYL